MEILRNLLGNVTSGIIRLLVAVGVLAACYVFLLKPVLNTTDKAIESTNKTFQQAFGPKAEVHEVNKVIGDLSKQVQREVRRSLHGQGAGNPKKLLRCIQRANGNVHKIQRCTVKF